MTNIYPKNTNILKPRKQGVTAKRKKKKLISTHSMLVDVLSAVSPKGIAPSMGFDNGQVHNLFHIQHCKTSHHLHNALLYNHS